MRMLGRACKVKAKIGIEWAGKWLTSGDKSSSPSAAIAVISFTILVGIIFHIRLDDMFDIAYFNQDIFRLQVGVYNTTFAMHVVEAQKHLLCDLLYQRHGNASMIPALDKTQEIFAQHLKNHAHVDTIGASMFKGIEKTNDMFSARMTWFGLNNLAEQFDLINCGLGIVSSGAHDLKGDVAIGNSVL